MHNTYQRDINDINYISVNYAYALHELPMGCEVIYLNQMTSL